MNCPICDKKMEYQSDYLDHILMEYGYKCRNCKRYIEHFVTGDYEVGIKLEGKWNVWQWSYNSPLSPHEEQAKNGIIKEVRLELEQ